MQAPTSETDFVVREGVGVLPAEQPGFQAMIQTGYLNHDRAMIYCGLAGALIGCAIGTWLMPQLSHKAAMYPVILPMATTNFGLVGGFAAAGLRKAILREGPSEERIPADSSIQTIFADYAHAEKRIAELHEIGVQPAQVTVVGTDSDALRDALTPLYRKKFNRLVLGLGALGALIGAGWGFVGCPQLGASVASVFMSTLMASFVGSLLGALTGATIGGIVHLDKGPATEAKVIEGSVMGGIMAISIKTADAAQRDKVLAIINQNS